MLRRENLRGYDTSHETRRLTGHLTPAARPSPCRRSQGTLSPAGAGAFLRSEVRRQPEATAASRTQQPLPLPFFFLATAITSLR